MEYRYAPRDDHRDLASGAVLRSRPGMPAFPVRLARELFGRARSHLADPGAPLALWDPCCGSAQLLVALGLSERAHLRQVVGSDVDPEMLDLARTNGRLLTVAGLAARERELRAEHERHGRPAHREAAEAARRLADGLACAGGDLPFAVHRADALDRVAVGEMVAHVRPDLVLADLPHGRMVSWSDTDDDVEAIGRLAATLGAALADDAVVVLVARSRRAPLPPGTRALERLRTGHRSAAIVRAGALAP